MQVTPKSTFHQKRTVKNYILRDSNHHSKYLQILSMPGNSNFFCFQLCFFFFLDCPKFQKISFNWINELAFQTPSFESANSVTVSALVQIPLLFPWMMKIHSLLTL